jgi:hypothetical protein
MQFLRHVLTEHLDFALVLAARVAAGFSWYCFRQSVCECLAMAISQPHPLPAAGVQRMRSATLHGGTKGSVFLKQMQGGILHDSFIVWAICTSRGSCWGLLPSLQGGSEEMRLNPI